MPPSGTDRCLTSAFPPAYANFSPSCADKSTECVGKTVVRDNQSFAGSAFRACTIAPPPHLRRVLRQYELIEKVRSYDPDADEALINRAYVFSMKAHGDQQRASGDP